MKFTHQCNDGWLKPMQLFARESIFNRKERKKVIEKLEAIDTMSFRLVLLKCNILLKCVGASTKRRTFKIANGYCSFNISSDKCIGKGYIYY